MLALRGYRAEHDGCIDGEVVSSAVSAQDGRNTQQSS